MASIIAPLQYLVLLVVTTVKDGSSLMARLLTVSVKQPAGESGFGFYTFFIHEGDTITRAQMSQVQNEPNLRPNYEAVC
ncbi:MAG: hypothetical protein V9G25_00335 [Acidimicrobiia bacterium]